MTTCSMLRRESSREAVAYGLYHHRFRAALSMLGISWGIISVVVLLAYGDGFRERARRRVPRRVLRRHGRRVPGADEPAGRRRARRQARARHAWTTSLAIGELPLVKSVSPEFMQRVPGRLRQQAVEPPGSRRGGQLRRDAQRDAAARRPIPRR